MHLSLIIIFATRPVAVGALLGQGSALGTSGGENQDVWVADLERGSLTRVTTDAGADTKPLWTPDGQSVVYESVRDGVRVRVKIPHVHRDKLAITKAGQQRGLDQLPEIPVAGVHETDAVVTAKVADFRDVHPPERLARTLGSRLVGLTHTRASRRLERHVGPARWLRLPETAPDLRHVAESKDRGYLRG